MTDNRITDLFQQFPFATVVAYHHDAGHGWLRVPFTEIAALGIQDQISRYSYSDGQVAYLEEDLDAGTYLNARTAVGQPLDQPQAMTSIYDGADSPIRRLPRFAGPTDAHDRRWAAISERARELAKSAANTP